MKKYLLLLPHLIISFAASAQADSTKRSDTASFNKLQQMSTVLLKTKKPFIEKLIDKTVLNIKNDIIASGGTVFEVLQRAPGVSIRNEESISMSGKTGVNVLIDGRATQLSEKDLAIYLKSMPAANVEKVELITNPSARYDAQGNAGVINIILKKLKVSGTNGNISSTYSKANHYRYTLSGNVNHRADNLNFFGNASAGKALQFTSGKLERVVTTGSIEKIFSNSTIDKDRSRQYNAMAGADWQFNKRNIIGLVFKTNESINPMFTPGVTAIKSGNSVDSSLNTINDNRMNSHSNSLNLNYKYEDTSGTVLNIDADYVLYKNFNGSNVETELFNNLQQGYGFTKNDQNVSTDIAIKSCKVDYSSRFIKNWKIELGLKIAGSSTSNDILAFYLSGSNSMTPDTARTNTFVYRENVYAGYASMSGGKKKWQYQAGVRSEYSNIKGASENLKKTRVNYPDTAYMIIFPSFFLSYKITANHQLGLSAGKRIQRPSYQDLNPFEYQFDNYSSRKGNPYLQPQITRNLELNYTYKYLLDLSVGTSNTKNFFQTISSQYGEKTQAVEYNVGQESRLYVNIGLTFSPAKWWSSYSNLSPFFSMYNGNIPSGSINNRSTGMGWYSSQNFNLGKSYKAQLSSWGSVGTRDALFKTKALGSVDLAISKSVLKERLAIRIAALDIFNTQRWQQQVDFANMNFVYHRKWESRAARMQLSWKFGKTSYKQRERSLGADDQMSRIKEK